MSALTQQKQSLIQQLVQESTQQELVWISGYLYGLSESAGGVGTAPTGAAAEVPAVTILVGTQTGNSTAVAEKLKDAINGAGGKASVTDMLDYRAKGLKDESHVIVVTSTYGEGEPPDTALEFYNTVMGKKGPKMNDASYAVLGLGDSSYEFFCKTAADFDKRFAELGATSLLPRVDCDVDYDEQVDQWISELVPLVTQAAAGTGTVDAAVSAAAPATNWSEKNPFNSEVLSVINITDDASEKDVWHLELSLEDSGIQYQPGDIVALLPKNDAELVKALIAKLGFNADDSVTIDGESLTLEQAFTAKLDITALTKPVITAYYEANNAADALANLSEDELNNLVNEADLIDLLEKQTNSLTAQALVDLLRPLRSRQYSIASSQAYSDDEVHVTVKQVVYETLGRERKGVCSNWLAELEEGDSVPLYIKPNPGFKLPESDQKIIMIGAGTGVAPFRSFMQEREEQGAQGNSWLFFGEQRFTTDFLYQTEWQKYVKDGILEKISLAWSRDQEEKIYVQNRIIDNGAELFEWLEQGSYIYVCGDRTHMAKDVNQALLDVIAKHGDMSAEDAEAYLQKLTSDRRYQKDVY